MIDRKHLMKLLSPTEWVLRLVFWGGALAVGAVAVLFALGAQFGNRCFHWILSISPWLSFLVLQRALPFLLGYRGVLCGSQGSGIPQVIAALKLQNPEQIGGLLSLRLQRERLF